MNDNVSIVVITGGNWRHKFVANYLIEHMNVFGVVCEKKKPVPEGKTNEENEVFKSVFKERDQKEIGYFGEHKEFNLSAEKILFVSQGESNSRKVYEWVTRLNPKYIILFGSSIIKDPLLSHYEGKIINMHLGLSPYYRGVATNFWPLVYNEPECVGVTVHLAVLDVDAGSILGQIRPDIVNSDDVHDVGNKAIVEGVKLLEKCISGYDTGRIKPLSQSGKGKLFKRKDINHKSVIKMLDNFRNGMIEKYLAHKEERVKRYPITEI